MEDSIKIALQYPVSDASFYNLIPFPNTELFEWVKKKNYFVESPDDYLDSASHWVNKPLFATPEFTYEERKKAYHYANGLMKQHVKKEARKRENWLIKQKFYDYYGISGFQLNAVAWIYTLPFLYHIREAFMAFIRRKFK